ncbi:MAG TPA: L,D-transpeptidase [Candidatus Competibacteraceae bacterium]|nr:L,D-transpeptidase [Candidatus Competibacteraceae bacterium]
MWKLGQRIMFMGILVGLSGGCAPNIVEQRQPPLPLTTARDPALREPWLLIDTKADKLMVMRDHQPLEVFDQIAVGSSGAGLKHRRGDNKTPLGVFRVGWVNDHSRFKKFIGLDYPNPDYAERALRERRIDHLTYERIRAAWMSGHTPPQNTPLGGQIGIHGVGAGNPQVHEAGIDWTSGCVALNNAQIDALRPWVKVGMRVEIR